MLCGESRWAFALLVVLALLCPSAGPVAGDTFVAPRCFDVDRDRELSHRVFAEPFDIYVNHRERIADCRVRLAGADSELSADLHLTITRYHYLLNEPEAMAAQLQKAARYGSREARYWRGVTLVVTGDPEKTTLGREMIEAAAAQGSPHANMRLRSERASRNPVGPKRCRQALDPLHIAAGAGFPEAHYHLGVFQLLGVCLEKDTKKGLERLSRVTGSYSYQARFAAAYHLATSTSEDIDDVLAGLRSLEQLADEGMQFAGVQLVVIYLGAKTPMVKRSILCRETRLRPADTTASSIRHTAPWRECMPAPLSTHASPSMPRRAKQSRIALTPAREPEPIPGLGLAPTWGAGRLCQ